MDRQIMKGLTIMSERMKLSKLVLLMGLCVLSLCIILLEGVPALAATYAASGSVAQNNAGKAVSSEVISRQKAAEALAFWTPERMRAAVPADAPSENVVPTKEGQGSSVPGQGMFKTVAPSAPTHAMQSQVTTASLNLKLNSLSYPFPFKRFEVTANYTQWPYSTLGRIFFNVPGGMASCSGSAISSNNKSVVDTAGHCVIQGGSHNGWYTNNWIFCPAYKDGNCPLGVWAARQLWSRTEWTDDDRHEFDLGEAVMWDINGTKLVDSVGGQGGAWNYARNQFYYDFGYPAANPFTGERLIECQAQFATTRNPDGIIGLLGPKTSGIGCDMTEGSSGGPWLIQFGSNGGYINGHNSYRPTNQPKAIYSPYFGNQAYSLYNAAQNA
jgi:V8-like Glu-specific endopeptidase